MPKPDRTAEFNGPQKKVKKGPVEESPTDPEVAPIDDAPTTKRGKSKLTAERPARDDAEEDAAAPSEPTDAPAPTEPDPAPLPEGEPSEPVAEEEPSGPVRGSSPPDPEPEPDDAAYNRADADGLYAVYVGGKGDAGVRSAFNIELAFAGDGWTSALQAEVIRAAEYVGQLIEGDLPDVGDIDDIRIDIDLRPMDGAYDVIAEAAPRSLRADSYLPYLGAVSLDSADADRYRESGLLDDVAAHEMLHALGFGSLWSFMGLVRTAGDGGSRFVGENATAAYQAEFASIADGDAFAFFGVPVESDGGAGAASVHWDEETFGNELQTGYVQNANYLSGMSVASLEDMGYDTRFDIANPNAPMMQIDELFLA